MLHLLSMSIFLIPVRLSKTAEPSACYGPSLTTKGTCRKDRDTDRSKEPSATTVIQVQAKLEPGDGGRQFTSRSARIYLST
ncbi:hypothetical protein M011DRAFT_17774 [Sporormia fimetaria CBS 119925]|uniref:Secreted protein n=1 Tax=Sporormia fimetaria CBS 119925 TaxID=1340428 RepID=A0A6A6VNH5_9PLEO|nr:hypothetical protein M011DRAFT_17774 [Sporormia fimetaria CBS 119925]